VTEISDPLIEPVLTFVSECFPSHQDLAFTAFAALCESAGEGIRPFVGAILALVEQVVALSPRDFPLPKACGIEALGSLIACAPAETAEFAESGPALFLECAASDDIFAYSSGVLALTSLARSESFSVQPDATFSVLAKSLRIEVDPAIAVYESTAEAKTLALRLLTALLKFHPDAVAPFSTAIAPLVANHFEISHLGVQTAAMQASVDLARLTGLPAPGFLENLAEHLEDSNPAFAALGFRGFARLLKRGLVVDERNWSSVM
jgi:hypothetical protein